MEAVLISIQPKWCELITSGKKTVEVRKTKPKLGTPFKCYIYCTNGKPILGRCLKDNSLKATPKTDFDNYNKDTLFRANGKVIGEFVCNLMTSFKAMGEVQALYNEAKETCISHDEIIKYANGKRLYYWHISDLKIYDKPRELSEFSKYGFVHPVPLKRPPQSWMYVEVEG
ncbi:MAG: hypothetical protein E7663_04820 [Ruminococcaceae bacterium]|nr:hypothetical protein [Oscillospiraceae bacterium]